MKVLTPFSRGKLLTKATSVKNASKLHTNCIPSTYRSCVLDEHLGH